MIGQGDGSSKVIPVLQRLMSQGAEERPVISEKVQVHTLESLEKMHTTKTTEGATAASAGKKLEVRLCIWKYLSIEPYAKWNMCGDMFCCRGGI